MWEFATSNPGTTLLIIAVIAWAFTVPFRFAFLAYNRHLRNKAIVVHGWPTAPVDADGDVVYPEKDS